MRIKRMLAILLALTLLAAIGLPATKRVSTRNSGPRDDVTFSTFVSALVA